MGAEPPAWNGMLTPMRSASAGFSDQSLWGPTWASVASGFGVQP